MTGCRVTNNGTCWAGLHLDEHLLIDGDWRHPDEGFTYEDEDVTR